MKRDPSKLTKADTVALWYAVAAFDLCARAMKEMDFTPEQIEAERARVLAAKSALRKVNALRRAGS